MLRWTSLFSICLCNFPWLQALALTWHEFAGGGVHDVVSWEVDPLLHSPRKLLSSHLTFQIAYPKTALSSWVVLCSALSRQILAHGHIDLQDSW